jgi:hypothetical protein
VSEVPACTVPVLSAVSAEGGEHDAVVEHETPKFRGVNSLGMGFCPVAGRRLFLRVVLARV